MTNKDEVDVTFGIDFNQAVNNKELARAIIDAFEHEGGFEDLADKCKVVTSLGLRFADGAVKGRVMGEASKAPISMGRGLDHYEMDDVDERASAYVLSGTLKSCLETAAEAIKSMDLVVGFADSFERANEGKKIHPEIKAFYLWMDRKLNDKLQPTPKNT